MHGCYTNLSFDSNRYTSISNLDYGLMQSIFFLCDLPLSRQAWNPASLSRATHNWRLCEAVEKNFPTWGFFCLAEEKTRTTNLSQRWGEVLGSLHLPNLVTSCPVESSLSFTKGLAKPNRKGLFPLCGASMVVWSTAGMSYCTHKDYPNTQRPISDKSSFLSLANFLGGK